MAKKKTASEKPKRTNVDAFIEGAGIVVEQPITETLEQNYMPYAMSVIISRALPEIDGLKPSHRKLLYTMYKMGLLGETRTKSANIVGSTMKLNPHGDAAIYETMVRMSRGYEALLHPYVDSKGNFGKAYSRDMAYAASRYTEAKLEKICTEMFRDIDKDTVDFVPNYDNQTTEPVLFPTTFPNILTNSNVGIAVSMASNICSFNLKEVCETTIALLKNPDHDISETILGPDFAGGGFWLYDKSELLKVIETGRGSFKVRGKYRYDKAENCIEITEIPSTTTVEAIIDKTVELIKQNRIREISDMRDETDLNGLKITIDLKRGQDPDKLMQKLFKMTPLQESFSCNFNILIGGYPRVMGIKEILTEWIAFRTECVKRGLFFTLQKKQEKLHLLMGLKKILLDIDKAVRIVRETEEEKEVIPNLMIGFGIDDVQAEFVAEIKLRHLNREYILKRTDETETLEKEIADLQETLNSRRKLNNVIIDDLKRVSEKYAKPRKTLFIYEEDIAEIEEEEVIEDYPVTLFFTAEGYFKKMTPQALRLSGEQKLKENDRIVAEVETTNRCDLLFFTDKHQVYKASASDFSEGKARELGEYIPARLSFEQDESIVCFATTKEYNEHMLFFFENGKLAKVPLSSYQTKTKRKKLANAYSDKSPLVAAYCIKEDGEYSVISSAKKLLIVNTAMASIKAARDTIGVQVMTLRKNAFIQKVKPFTSDSVADAHRFRSRNLPAAGAEIKAEDLGEQLKLS